MEAYKWPQDLAGFFQPFMVLFKARNFVRIFQLVMLNVIKIFVALLGHDSKTVRSMIKICLERFGNAENSGLYYKLVTRVNYYDTSVIG